MCCTKASSVMWEKLSSALLVFVCGKFCFCDENEWEMKEKSEEEEKLYEITQKRSGSVRSTQWRFIYDVRRKLCEMPSITINFAFIFGPFCAVLNLVAALSPAPSLAGLLCVRSTSIVQNLWALGHVTQSIYRHNRLSDARACRRLCTVDFFSSLGRVAKDLLLSSTTVHSSAFSFSLSAVKRRHCLCIPFSSSWMETMLMREKKIHWIFYCAFYLVFSCLIRM